MKRLTLKLIADLALVAGDLGAKIRRLPDGADSLALERVELALRDALANLHAVRNTLAAPEQPIATATTPYVGPVDDGA